MKKILFAPLCPVTGRNYAPVPCTVGWEVCPVPNREAWEREDKERLVAALMPYRDIKAPQGAISPSEEIAYLSNQTYRSEGHVGERGAKDKAKFRRFKRGN